MAKRLENTAQECLDNSRVKKNISESNFETEFWPRKIIFQNTVCRAGL